MKDGATVASANGCDEQAVKTADDPGEDKENGGVPRKPQQPLTNGHASQKKPEAWQDSEEAYENAMLNGSDISDGDLNLELLSDEDGACSAESTASTIIFSPGSTDVAGEGKDSEVMDSAASLATAASANVAPSTSDLTEESAAVMGSAAPEESSVAENGDRSGASSPDCVVIEESEAIVDSKSSAKAPTDAATDSVSNAEQDVAMSKVEEAPSVADRDDGDNVARTGVRDSALDSEVVELGDSSKEKDRLVDGIETVAVQGEVGSRETEETTANPEIQVIDIDDSSSESNDEKSPVADVAKSDEVSKKPELQVSVAIDDDVVQRDSSDSLLEACAEESEEAAHEMPESEADDSRADSKEVDTDTLVKSEESDVDSKEIDSDSLVKAEGALSVHADEAIDKLGFENADESVHKQLESVDDTVYKLAPKKAGEVEDQVILDKADEVVDKVIIDKTAVAADELPTEKADEAVDIMILDKADEAANNVSLDKAEEVLNQIILDKADVTADKLPMEKSDDVVDTVMLDKAEEVVEKVILDKAAKVVEQVSLDKADEVVDKVSLDKADATVDQLPSGEADVNIEKLQLETAASTDGTSSSVDEAREVAIIDEKKAQPTFTAEQIVAEILESLVTDVADKADRNRTETTNADAEKDNLSTEEIQDRKPESPLESKVDDHEVISIGDDSNESSDKVKEETLTETRDSILASILASQATSSLCDNAITDESVDSKSKTKASDQTDDSKTLLDVTPRPNNENITITEDYSKCAKRTTPSNPDDDDVRAKRSKGEDGSASTGVRSLSKENLNPAKKRGAGGAAGVSSEAKKARIESLRERKPAAAAGDVERKLRNKRKFVSNLDKSIARVASGGITARQQEIADLVAQLGTNSVVNLTLSQVEDLIQHKFGRFILDKSDCKAYRVEIKNLKAEVDKWQHKATGLSKQLRDLENVMKKMLTDIKNLPVGALPIPSKVNRSVGLQVGDGRISNEQKKLAIPRYTEPPVPVPVPSSRRVGLITNRPVTAATRTNLTSTTTAYATTATTTVTVPVQRIRAPAPVLNKSAAPGYSPALSAANRTAGTHVPFTPSKVSSAPPASPSHVSAGMTLLNRQTRAASSPSAVARSSPTAARSSPGALIDLTDGDEAGPSPPTPRQFPLPPARQVAPAKIRVINPVNPAPNSVVTSKQTGSIRLVTQSSLMAMGGSVLTVARPNNAQQKAVVFSTNATQAQALRGFPTGFRPSTFIPANRPAPGSVVRARNMQIDRKVLHPAPLPPTPPTPPSNVGWKKPPPVPDLKISKCDKRSRGGGESGIILSWKMDVLGPDHEDILSYQLYAYQETTAEPSTSMWKKVGDVKSMALPMACTLTQFTEGNKYHFAVRAVDARGRIGPFSKPGNILLAATFDD